MFKTTIKQVIPVPKREFFLFSGDMPVNGLEIGSYVTDGFEKYEVLTIPLIHRTIDDVYTLTDFVLKPGDYDPMELVGRTLYAV